MFGIPRELKIIPLKTFYKFGDNIHISNLINETKKSKLKLRYGGNKKMYFSMENRYLAL